jgi:hypothetical protein
VSTSFGLLRDRLSWPVLGVLALVGLGLLLASEREARARLDEELAALTGRIGDLRSRLQAEGSEAQLALAEEDVWAPVGEETPERRLQAFALEGLELFGQTLLRYEQVALPHETHTPTIALQLEFTGPLDGVVGVLRRLEEARPRLAVERLTVRGLSDYEQVEGQTMVACQLLVWGFARATLD